MIGDKLASGGRSAVFESAQCSEEKWAAIWKDYKCPYWEGDLYEGRLIEREKEKECQTAPHRKYPQVKNRKQAQELLTHPPSTS